MNFNYLLSTFPNFPELFKKWMENPDKLKELYKNLRKFNENMKEFYNMELMKVFYQEEDKEKKE